MNKRLLRGIKFGVGFGILLNLGTIAIGYIGIENTIAYTILGYFVGVFHMFVIENNN